MATTPSRGRGARSNITGAVPDSLDPGAFAINWADRKIYFGDPGGGPVRFSQWLDTWSPDRFYYAGDFVLWESAIWRALRDVAAGTPFSSSDWDPVTLSARGRYSEPVASGCLTGGVATLAADGVSLDIAAGGGLVVGAAQSGEPVIAEVTWDAFNFPLAGAADGWNVVGVTAGGTAALAPAEDGAYLAQHLALAHVLWNATAGAVDAVVDATAPVSGGTRAALDEYFAQGGAFRTSGLALAPSAGLTVRLSDGEVFALGANWRGDLANPNLLPVAGADPLAFRYATRGAYAGALTTGLDFEHYDNGGTLTPAPGGAATIQYLTYTPLLNEFSLQYGQTTYATVDAAIAVLQADWAAAVKYAAGGPTVLLAALVAAQGMTSTAAGLRIVHALRGAPFLHTGYGGGVDLSGLLPRSGALPMTGALDMAGNAIVGGRILGDASIIAAKTVAGTGTAPGVQGTPAAGELIVNVTDGKLWTTDAAGGPRLVSQNLEAHDPARAYRAGDLVLSGAVLWQAPAAVAAGAFNSANWTAIGVSSAAAGALLKVPTGDTYNTIDLTGAPTRRGLVIQGAATQSAPLLSIPGTAAVDDRKAEVDQLGFPNSRFGEVVFRVGQASHPFSQTGQAVAYSGGQYVLANAADPAKAAIGVVEQVLDGNSFVVRTGGRIQSLSPTAFAGGVITAGTKYYVSDTVPGQLTTVASAVRPDPVLRTLTSSSGVVLGGAGSAATDFVRRSGDTMSGALTLAAAVKIQFENTSNYLQKFSESSAISVVLAGAEAARIEPAGASVSAAQAVITKEKLALAVLDIVFPVGSVFITTNNVNPSTRFSGTTWALTSAGRAIVGVGTADGKTWSAGMTDGANSVALGVGNLPWHTHSFEGTTGDQSQGHTHGGTTSSDTHSHAVQLRTEDVQGTGSGYDGLLQGSGVTVYTNSNTHNHTFITGDQSQGHAHSFSGTTGGVGSGAKHDNVQPSMGFYVWTRTA